MRIVIDHRMLPPLTPKQLLERLSDAERQTVVNRPTLMKHLIVLMCEPQIRRDHPLLEAFLTAAGAGGAIGAARRDDILKR